MGELKFVFKTLLATIAVIALMQLKVGEKTIESKTYQMLAQSKLADFLNDVARGSVQLGRQLKEYADQQIKELKQGQSTK